MSPPVPALAQAPDPSVQLYMYPSVDQSLKFKL